MRQQGCRDCDQMTSGDCGKHGPTIVTNGVTIPPYAPAPRLQCPTCGAPVLHHGERHAVIREVETRPLFYAEEVPLAASPLTRSRTETET